MSVLIRLAIVAMVAVGQFGHVYSQDIAVTDPESITVQMLWDHWIENQRGLRELHSLAIEAKVQRFFQQADIGVRHELITVHSIRPNYRVTQGECIEISEGSLNAPRKPFYVAIDTPSGSSYLNRDDEQAQWRIATLNFKRTIPPVFLFEKLFDIPVPVSSQEKPLDELFSYTIVSRSPSSIKVHFLPFCDEARVVGGPRSLGKMSEMDVVFSRAEEWLPTRVDRLVKTTVKDFEKLAEEMGVELGDNVKGSSGYGTILMEKYTPVDGVLVPRHYGIGGGAKKNWKYGQKPAEEVEIKSIRVVSQDEVTERASLEFWGLPDQRASSGMSYRLIAILSLIVISALVYGGLKLRARAT